MHTNRESNGGIKRSVATTLLVDKSQQPRITKCPPLRLSFNLQRKAMGSDLYEQVFYSLDLIEKDYFGLQFTDANNVQHWLDATKVVKKQVKSECQFIYYWQEYRGPRYRFFPPPPLPPLFCLCLFNLEIICAAGRSVLLHHTRHVLHCVYLCFYPHSSRTAVHVPAEGEVLLAGAKHVARGADPIPVLPAAETGPA